MTQKQLQQAGELYRLDRELSDAYDRARRITRQLNATDETQQALRQALVRELFGSAGEGVLVEPPFRCDYGYNIHVGDRFYCNYDCIFLDCGPIHIGDRVMLGPRVQIYTASHALDAQVRSHGHDLGIPVTLGNGVWIGGGSILCPGCSVGDNTVIGAGSVVTGRIPANVVAAGNPCRVLRPLGPEDRQLWQQRLERHLQLSEKDPEL